MTETGQDFAIDGKPRTVEESVELDGRGN